MCSRTKCVDVTVSLALAVLRVCREICDIAGGCIEGLLGMSAQRLQSEGCSTDERNSREVGRATPLTRRVPLASTRQELPGTGDRCHSSGLCNRGYIGGRLSFVVGLFVDIAYGVIRMKRSRAADHRARRASGNGARRTARRLGYHKKDQRDAGCLNLPREQDLGSPVSGTSPSSGRASRRLNLASRSISRCVRRSASIRYGANPALQERSSTTNTAPY
jgi:hypothetical protein